jgi:hypothetical protein
MPYFTVTLHGSNSGYPVLGLQSVCQRAGTAATITEPSRAVSAPLMGNGGSSTGDAGREGLCVSGAAVGRLCSGQLPAQQDHGLDGFWRDGVARQAWVAAPRKDSKARRLSFDLALCSQAMAPGSRRGRPL